MVCATCGSTPSRSSSELGGVSPKPLQTLRLQPEPDADIIVDVLEGAAPALIYLHGLSSLRVGTKSEALLQRARKLGLAFARFDFRGHGDSPGLMHELTLSELIQDGLCVLRHMGPSILIGSSMGGMVAAWVAARGGNLVQGALLLCPALGFLPRMAAQEGDFYLQDSEGNDIVFSAETLCDARRYDEGLLPGLLTMPTLLAHGRQDEVVPWEVSQRLFDGIPHGQKELLLMDGSHRLHEEIEVIYDRMEDFFLPSSATEAEHG